MAKALAVLTAVLVGCLLLVSFPVEETTAKVEDNWYNGIWIFSPANTTYTSNTLLLNVTSKRMFSPNYYNSQLKYSLNGAENVTIPTTDEFVDMSIPGTIFSYFASYTLISGEIALPKLPEGANSLTVYGEYNRAEGVDSKYPNMYDIQTIYFTINNGVPPSITLLQFENTTYEKDNLPLNFVVDEPVSWMGYSFDGQANVTVSGNFTFSELASGVHNVTIYAKDLLGNIGASETTIFTVTKPEQIEPWSVGVLATVIFIVSISAILFLYRKSFSRKRYFLVPPTITMLTYER